jgi:Zn-dependent peptidase ImmA (M78 family)
VNQHLPANLSPKYWSKEALEAEVMRLLQKFAGGVVLAAPVDVESLLENYKHVHLEFDDLRNRYGVDGFGLFLLDERKVVIDERLDPSRRNGAAALGLYRFTIAHELGHVHLHSELLGHWKQAGLFVSTLFSKEPGTLDLPGGEMDISLFVAHRWVEWQANVFASRLLMPTSLIEAAWPKTSDGLPAALSETTLRARCGHHWDTFFARKFQVSRTAIRIRLSELGLLQRQIAAKSHGMMAARDILHQLAEEPRLNWLLESK